MSNVVKQYTNKVNYNLLAEEYALHRQVQPEVFARIVSQGEITSQSDVLEVGCGTGNYISAIQAATDSLCWGIDPSFQMLAKAREKCDGVQYQIGRGEEIEFPDHSFDVVFSVDVIHHIKDRLSYIREAYRVLKPGGRFATVTESSWMICTRKPFAVYFPETVAVDLERYPKLSFMRNTMTYTGFEAVTSQAVSFAFLRSDVQDFQDKAYSCLHLISPEGFRIGIERMESDLKRAPIQWDSRYLILWGRKPGGQKTETSL